MRLEIIIASTRPGRVGKPIGDWITAKATAHGGFDVHVADLAEISLPFLDEPNHPDLQQYTKPHTIEWSKRIDAADAFVIVTPEYNFTPPAPLVNAFDYLYNEWNYKPLSFVSYGGISGGTRSVQTIKLQATTVKMAPVREAVNIPFVKNYMSEDNATFSPTDSHERAAEKMLDELLRWAEALKPMRKA